MSDQTPRAIPVVDDAAPESLAEASFETDAATGKRPAYRESHTGPGLWARAREAFFALPRGLHIVILIIFMILGFALATQVRAQHSDPLRDSPSRTSSPSWTSWVPRSRTCRVGALNSPANSMISKAPLVRRTRASRRPRKQRCRLRSLRARLLSRDRG